MTKVKPRKKKKIYEPPTTTEEAIKILKEDPTPTFGVKLTFKEWLAQAPIPIEGLPTRRQYAEWLPKYKAWLAAGEQLA